MKTSTALLAAWIVLIAALIAAIVFFTLKGQSPPEPVPPDETVRPLPGRSKPPDKPNPPRHAGRTPARTSTPPKQLEITGLVRGPAAELVPGAKVALFRPTKPGQPAAPADMEELRVVSQIVYVTPEEWDLPRSLATWTGGSDEEAGADHAELAATESKEDGTFRIALPPGIGAGPFRLTAAKEDVGSAAVAEVSAGANLELSLGQASIVKGTVVTEVDSIAVEGARVSFDNGLRRLSATTGAGGAFEAAGVMPGFYQLSVAAKGRTPLFDGRFKIHANDPTPLTLRLPRGTTLRVKAVVERAGDAGAPPPRDADGEPVPDAQVVALCEETYTYAIGRTNREGVAEFPGLPAGRYAVNGLAKGVVSMGETTVIVDRNQLAQEETITFEPAVETTVEVVDEDGRAIAGVDFYTCNVDEAYDSLRSARAGTTDADGKIKFAFEFDAPRCAIFGFKPGHALVRAYPDNYDDGDPIRLVAKRPVHVHGVVKTTDGRPIADAAVSIIVEPEGDSTAGDLQLEIRADRDGRYDFPFLPRSEGITVSATAPDGVSQEELDLELVAGKDDYTLDIELELDEVPPSKPRAPREMPPR